MLETFGCRIHPANEQEEINAYGDDVFVLETTETDVIDEAGRSGSSEACGNPCFQNR